MSGSNKATGPKVLAVSSSQNFICLARHKRNIKKINIFTKESIDHASYMFWLNGGSAGYYG